jgi:hypothetical protein
VIGDSFFSSIESMNLEYTPAKYEDCTYFHSEDNYESIEAVTFQKDIRDHLMAWAVDIKNKTVFYRTRRYWYAFMLLPGPEVILCSRFPKKRRKDAKPGKRKNCWILPEICTVGRDWLQDYSHKRVPLIPVTPQIRIDFDKKKRM